MGELPHFSTPSALIVRVMRHFHTANGAPRIAKQHFVLMGNRVHGPSYNRGFGKFLSLFSSFPRRPRPRPRRRRRRCPNFLFVKYFGNTSFSVFILLLRRRAGIFTFKTRLTRVPRDVSLLDCPTDRIPLPGELFSTFDRRGSETRRANSAPDLVRPRVDREKRKKITPRRLYRSQFAIHFPMKEALAKEDVPPAERVLETAWNEEAARRGDNIIHK